MVELFSSVHLDGHKKEELFYFMIRGMISSLQSQSYS